MPKKKGGGETMKRENSYLALTKALALANQQKKEKLVESIYIDILLYESLLREKRAKLKEKIDSALDQKDRNKFFELTKQLQEIEKQLNA